MGASLRPLNFLYSTQNYFSKKVSFNKILFKNQNKIDYFNNTKFRTCQ
ncbi:hypothetical protein EBME_0637 [bacterium endosymbiont of Mortierella elongata FMR23-6]|nr:hypothetical protein EBME_0637 [bacterium endosymbiont of Mortierella elongata FMR23-6]